jgi:hypothetical protein
MVEVDKSEQITINRGTGRSQAGLLVGEGF